MPSANVWSLTNRSATAAATATQAAPTNGATAGNPQLRLRSLQASLVGSGSDRLVVRDGASGSGTIIFSADMAAAAGTAATLSLSRLDLRATPGNALTIEFVTGTGSAEDVNAQGDYVPQGSPWGI